jgi:enoyl-CoA hydratase
MTEGASAGSGRIAFDTDGEIAILTIDRPAKLNALDSGMLIELEERLAAVDRDTSLRVILVTGAGERSFCVGADVRAWSALDPLDMWRIWVRDGHRVLQRLAGLRQPTIAAINGYAFGGGLELALATDIRIASDRATFAMPETKIGTLPGWDGTRRLAESIGSARAKQMIFSGVQIDAVTAERWNLVNEVVRADDLMTRTMELARTIAANAPVAVQLAKAAISGDPAALEGFAGALAAGTNDGHEGLAAFREKRAPRFTGQ